MDAEPGQDGSAAERVGDGPGGRRYAVVTLILSLVGGFTDAGSYVLAGSFTGHLTGNTVLGLVHAAGGAWWPALACLLAVAAFLAGTAAGAGWPDTPGRSGCRRLAGPVLLEVALVGLGLAVLVAFGPSGKEVMVLSVCLAMGVQNGAVGRIRSVAYHTTFITGLSTTLVTTMVAGKPGPKRRVLPPIIACFVAGALCGAAVVIRAGAYGFGAVLALLATAWVLAATDRS